MPGKEGNHPAEVRRIQILKILLAACNAKYIHSNLAVYNLKSCSGEYSPNVVIKEYTINQIRDDILDVTSDMETLGKPIGSDEKNHKTTYVTIRGLEQAQKDVEEISQRALDGLASLKEKNGYLDELVAYLIHRKK